jgi:2-oxoisovalerate dehydrogenase E2 component (dihydrolipoyl transacylase)
LQREALRKANEPMATTIKMPQLGESVTEGTIERWLVKEGDTVAQYDPLFEVVTDKVNAEVPAEVAGTVTKILVPDGETVAVGTAVAEIDSEGGAAAASPSEPAAEAPEAAAVPEPAPAEAEPAAAEQPAQEEPEPQVAASAAPEPEPEPEAAEPELELEAAPASSQAAASAPPDGDAATGDGGARMTPAVRRLVREHGIDIAQVSGTGAGGRVTRDDVLAFVAKGASAATPAAEPAAQAAAPAPAAQPAEPAPAAPAAPASPAPTPAPAPAAAAGDTEIPLSQMRKGIARKMTQVKQTVPHAYTVVEVDMTNVVRWREANNMAFKAREGASLSYVAVVVKAVTETLRKHPTLNSQFAEDRIILKQAMNIGIAVAVDNGLIVPVIHNADQLSISGVNTRIRDISSRAHAGKLRLDELQGGTFTVNNTGWFGSVVSMPIVNAPEVAILSMEAIVKRPRVIEVGGEDVIAVRHMMNMTCSFDHRVLDGAQVGFFLADVRSFLEEWDAATPLG